MNKVIYAIGSFTSSISIILLCYVSVINIESKEFPHVWVGSLMVFFGVIYIICFVAGTRKNPNRVR